ncbi:MAG: hypothetical protein CSA55_03335 [Ilumatobacter coccineus]|uniref:Mycothiol-dependent maleylpyruvate isomerase metal-binding domain-containing protein n=1 Tax=Ilumatobacter coccineus TaxID=467094 RepID=A0A2G6K9W3_9ACTN|nr:MAG: hypothetical protein CSA55_03335 [Ilumatobacter coccineus]
MVASERLALCDLLEQLEPDEWQTQSLCADWTVRDVVAHLTLATEETLRGMIVGMIKARGSFDRMNTNAAIKRSRDVDPPELIQRLRESASSSQRNPMSTPADQLIDILVHTQDIARPLGRATTMIPEHVVPALDHAVDSRWYGGKKRFATVRLVATDISWEAGSGTLRVEGTSGDLLLLATGRTSALEHLDGPGVNTLVRQYST